MNSFLQSVIGPLLDPFTGYHRESVAEANSRFSKAFGSGVVWTPERIALAEENNRMHREWIASAEGQSWLLAQSWFKEVA